MLRLVALIFVCTLLVLELVINKPEHEKESENGLVAARTGQEPSLHAQTISLDVEKNVAGNTWQEDSEYFAYLGIDPQQHGFSEPYMDARAGWDSEHGDTSLLTLWRSDQPVDIEFTYQSDIEQEHDVIELSLIQQDAEDGELYFSGISKDDGAARTFNVSKIITKISYAGMKYSIEDFIVDRLSADLSAA